ncbi:LOW QUALITY PROTEIN: hypothetical protein Cgig2_034003 [Carnegiea gigantea]|uniref:Retrotransposon gag domain-containing protein n=1 Tax=Carnegiea gigantea TaxID=171969 RepID=A0A9Q1JXJ0_9CARY|nr:LOW QUALITY PROTEIN: hypothetical protein Cgig2_034003 [Carnegiea gigantea]
MEAVSSMRPLPTFNYVPTAGYKPSHKNEWFHKRNHDCSPGHPSTTGPLGGLRGTRELCDCIHTIRNLLPVHGLSKSKPQGLRKELLGGGALLSTRQLGSTHVIRPHEASILMDVKGHTMLRKPQPMTAVPEPYNAWKYCKFHQQNGHSTVRCWELKKTLHELADKGQIDCFLNRGPQSLRKDHDLVLQEP